jgi:hypothetical protein
MCRQAGQLPMQPQVHEMFVVRLVRNASFYMLITRQHPSASCRLAPGRQVPMQVQLPTAVGTRLIPVLTPHLPGRILPSASTARSRCQQHIAPWDDQALTRAAS